MNEVKRAIERKHGGACDTWQRQQQNQNDGSAHGHLPSRRIELLRFETSSSAYSLSGMKTGLFRFQIADQSHDAVKRLLVNQLTG
jgi:hypothetical protein